jgi:hypothetical protein
MATAGLLVYHNTLVTRTYHIPSFANYPTERREIENELNVSLMVRPLSKLPICTDNFGVVMIMNLKLP